jgi:hypothetical protein
VQLGSHPHSDTLKSLGVHQTSRAQIPLSCTQKLTVPRYDARGVQFGTSLNCRQTTNLIINMDHDEWIFDDDAHPLAELSIGEPLERCNGSADCLPR